MLDTGTVAAANVAADATRFREPPAPPFELPKMPYKGLVPFDEVDGPFFFGRDLDRALVSANLTSCRFTILYGASGVGKSSILRAGAVPDLRELMRENIRGLGEPQLVVCGFTSWREKDPVACVEAVVRDAVGKLTSAPVVPDSRRERLPAVLAAASAAIGGKVLLVLDQFEEYFLYHPSAGDAFGRQLSNVVNDAGLRANVLVSIREDALAMLDRFQGEIPALFDNYLRLEHLDQAGAREAIVGPKDKWNELAPPEAAFEVDDDLVAAVLEELQTGRVVLDTLGHGRTDVEPEDDTRIETPFLQLVMTRLWDESRPTKSSPRRLRLETLERLGGSEEIVRTHLDKAMKVLPRFERYIAGRAFHYLVTPSGAKIAHAVGDLSEYADVSQADLRRVFGKLSAPDVRILRRLESVDGAEDDERFEIFHDVLAIAILDWRTRFLRGQRFVEGLKRTIALTLHFTLFGAWLIGLSAADDEGARDSVIAIWVIAGSVVWARATLVLMRRWRRRSVWLIPVVGLLAAGAGPIMLGLTVWVRLVRRWRRRRALRAEAAAATAIPRQRRARRRLKQKPVAVEPYVVGSALIGMAGSGLLIVGCSVPILHFDGGSYTLVDYGGWDAAQQLTVAAAIGLVAMVVLVRPLPRLLTSSLFFVFGVLALAEFAGWAALAASDESIDRGAGIVFGLLGSAVILARPVLPERILDVFAALIGAGEIATGDDSGRPRLLDRTRTDRRRLAVAAAVAVGDLLLFCGFFLPFNSFGDSWADNLGWYSFAPLTPAVGTALILLLLLVARPARLLIAGALLGFGLGALASFAGTVGRSVTEGDGIGSGTYCGLLGAAIVLAVGIVELRRSTRVT